LLSLKLEIPPDPPFFKGGKPDRGVVKYSTNLRYTTLGGTMKITLEELMTVTLAMTDALSKLLIEKGVVTDAEFKKKLGEERAAYQKILKSIEQ
jgi:hypothetical protein